MKYQSHIFIIFIHMLLVACGDSNKEESTSKSKPNNIKDSVVAQKNDRQNTIAPIGTQLLPNSGKSEIANELSPYFLKTISLAACQSKNGIPDYSKHNKLQNIYFTDSTFSVEFSFVANCGSDFLCEVEMIDENAINLIYHQYNSYASCRCCYSLQFNFNIHEYYDPAYFASTEKPKITFIQINGGKKLPIESLVSK